MRVGGRIDRHSNLSGDVVIEGGSLASAILATLLVLSGSRVRFHIETGRPLVTSWQNVSLSGIKMNNGYHAVDVARAPVLSDFLVNWAEVDYFLDRRGHGLVIEESIIDPLDKSANWPPVFKSLVEISGERYSSTVGIEGMLQDELLEFFRSISERYSPMWDESRHLLIPWFLPNNFLLNSRDEGDVYRNLVRKGVLEPARIQPRNATFQDWGNAWMKKLREDRLFELVETPAEEKSDFSSPISSAYFKLSLFRLGNREYERFCETLVCSRTAPNLARISPVSSEKEQASIVMAETFSSTENLTEEEISQEIALLTRTLGGASVSHLDSLTTRSLQRQENPTAIEPYQLEFEKGYCTVKFSRGRPINMAKAETLAIEVFRHLRGIQQ